MRIGAHDMLLALPTDGELYRAGRLAPPGRYLRVDSNPPIEVVLHDVDYLPASLDGHVALYQKIEIATMEVDAPLRAAS
jgi:hypothetical protein